MAFSRQRSLNSVGMAASGSATVKYPVRASPIVR
ncbi:MAG: hypothetical protein KatS3mg059_0598 [Thermomicrobiales bacterium]|nr:MAG: hypothetical protein KatS3mg059_0598 [Thermomicrobiales bacterium]